MALELNMAINIKVKNHEYDGSLREIIQINENLLTEEFVRQPGIYAWFATLMEIANSDVESKKFDLDVLKANLDGEKRRDLAKENQYVDDKGKIKDGRVTETMVSSAILTDKKFLVLTQELMESERQLGILKAIVRSLEQRKDMLIQLGVTKRSEFAQIGMGIDIEKVKENLK